MLSKIQKEIVLDNNHNLLIIAGAGSGKTYTLVEKVKYLLNNNIKENEILIISFTNESCNEITKRLNNRITALTFHKLALYLLSDYYLIDDNKIMEIILDYIYNNLNIAKINNILNFLILYENEFSIGFEYHKYQRKDIFKINKDIINNENKEDLYKFIIYNKKDLYINRLIKLLNNGIKVVKNNNYKINKDIKEERYLLFLKILEDIKINNYSNNEIIDFDDMINLAISKINNNEIKSNYKYIFIDEFQDISINRFELIKKLKDLNNSLIFSFGDDFQSIYDFSGSNINIFINYKKYIDNLKIYKLEESYRNSKELLNISNEFILKNQNQINKKMFSNKNIKHSIIKIKYFKDLNKVIIKIIKNIKYNNILILGRYDYQENIVKDIIKNNNKIKFLTIHKSKGLEADYVFIIMDKMPCLKKDDIIIEYLKNRNNDIINEEERRLFYVALTRSRNKVFLLYKEKNIYLKEIKCLKKIFYC